MRVQRQALGVLRGGLIVKPQPVQAVALVSASFCHLSPLALVARQQRARQSAGEQGLLAHLSQAYSARPRRIRFKVLVLHGQARRRERCRMVCKKAALNCHGRTTSERAQMLELLSEA